MASVARKQQLSEHLASVPLFATCTRSDLKILARHVQEVSVPAGVDLVKEGDRGDAFYIVISGTARVSSGNGRKAHAVADLGPGDSFGELAVLDPAPRNATVTADTDLVVGVLGARVFRAVIRDVPSLTERLLASMARRLRESDRVANEAKPTKQVKARSRTRAS